MALTLYCKKCKCDVPPGENCPLCGGKLNTNQLRAAWYIERTPAYDWMCWNSVMRILFPVMACVFLLAALLEAILDGVPALERVLPGILTALLGIMALLALILLLVFVLQGHDVMDCVADNKGIHVKTYLSEPTAFRLILRLKSPALLDADRDVGGMLMVSEKSIAWKDISRVQLWPEKALVLLYAPRWWLRVYLPCTPFSWDDTLGMISDKLGKKKNVKLPRELMIPEEPKPAKKKSTVAKSSTAGDIDPELLADIMLMNAEEERRTKGEYH